jgi:hypothetical protein
MLLWRGACLPLGRGLGDAAAALALLLDDVAAAI